MKKIFYLLLVSGLFFAACSPMDDIHEDIDAIVEIITGEVAFTMTDDDYDELGKGTYNNFNSIDEAKTLIPGLLDEKYPVWGEGSLATVTFDWYNPLPTPSKNVYELSDAEHNAVTGKTYGNFDRDYHIFNYLDDKYPSPSNGDFHSLRYRFWAGGESTLTDGFLFENGDWTKITGYTEDQYKAMGESYPNFSSHDEAEVKIPVTLPDKYKFDQKEEGDIVMVMYELYKGGGVTKSYVSNYILKADGWAKYTNVANETIKFGHDGRVWVPDNTIKYTLTGADYELVGNGYYQNFDVRPGKAEESVEARLEKINIILKNNFPGMQEGQKFIVTYDVYSGAAETWEMKVILSGGNYVLQ